MFNHPQVMHGKQASEAEFDCTEHHLHREDPRNVFDGSAILLYRLPTRPIFPKSPAQQQTYPPPSAPPNPCQTTSYAPAYFR